MIHAWKNPVISLWINRILSLYIALVFVQSLFFKFTNASETQHIFGTLDAWTASFGAAGLFAPTGLFSQYVVGSAELATAIILAVSFIRPGLVCLRAIGGLMAMGIMSGAIFFHLFTPLGIDVQGDGGLLFAMACGVWVSGLVLTVTNLPALIACFKR